MKPTFYLLGLVMAPAHVTGLATTAFAQQAATTPDRKVNITRGAQKAVLELQTAVNGNDAANIPSKLAAAKAVAKSADDNYYIGVLQLRAGIAAKDNAVMAEGLETMLASGGAEATELPGIHLNLGKAYGALKQEDRAAAALEKSVQLDPNNVESTILLAESRNRQGRVAEAVSLIQKGIALKAATGETVEENWYKRAVALAYNAKLPASVELSRDWAQRFPTSTNWRDALRIYRRMNNPDETTLLDTFRLARATKALAGETDYYEYAALADRKGFAGEAKAVLEEGAAAGGVDKNQSPVKDLLGLVTTKSQGDRASLGASATRAKAGTSASAAITVGDAYYGYGDFAEAADLYRAALTKTGVDANVANLKLGMTLARSGDKAGATAALKSVTGARAELAKFWLAYLATLA